MQKSEECTIGIDLGTTFNSVAYKDISRNEIAFLQDDSNQIYIPSIVSFNHQGKAIVGVRDLEGFSQVKRFMGLKYSDEVVQRDKEEQPFEVMRGENDSIRLKMVLNNREYIFTPEEVTALILIKLRKLLESKVLGGRKVKMNAVVTVPSNFKDSQIKATEKAVRMAGLNLIQTEREPTAAAFAFQYDRKMRSGKIMVFDFGGGTLDLSIVDTKNGIFDVKIPHGDNHFGGIDVDMNIAHYILDEMMDEEPDIYDGYFGDGVREAIRNRNMNKLKREVEKMKIAMSGRTQSYEMDFKFINREIDYSLIVTKEQFDEWNDVIYKQCIELYYECLEKNHLERDDIQKILLVGGTSMIPGVKAELRREFGDILDDSMNPNEAIALGAYRLAENRMTLRDGIVLPSEKTCHAIQIKDTNNDTIMFKDIIQAGASMPFTKTIEGRTHRNNQTSVVVEVYENKVLLNQFRIEHLPKRRAGVCKFDIIFNMSSNGRLTVSARLVEPTGFNLANSMTITPTVKDLDQEALERRGRELESYFP